MTIKKQSWLFFRIVNYIIDEMITCPQEIERIYSQLPGGTRRIADKPQLGIITPSKANRVVDPNLGH